MLISECPLSEVSLYNTCILTIFFNGDLAFRTGFDIGIALNESLISFNPPSSFQVFWVHSECLPVLGLWCQLSALTLVICTLAVSTEYKLQYTYIDKDVD